MVDLGANRGDFARAMVKEFRVNVHALEPDPSFHSDLASLDHVRLYRKCVAPTTGPVDLFLLEDRDATIFPPSDSSASTLTVKGVTLEEFVHELGVGEIDLLKIDVEGAELAVLEQVPEDVLRRARQITVEFHDWMMPGTMNRVESVKSRLRRSGFYSIRFSANNGDVLFIRRDLLSPVKYGVIAFIVRNVMGLGRLIRRRMP